jgi:FkbM family methyltransferase
MLSYSQLGQDLWILEQTQYKKHGFFLDIGASDGIKISNTYLLEKEYSWDGVCCEPSSSFQKLKGNRKCHLENSCVYFTSNENIEFHETLNNIELSGIKSLFKDDEHTENRKNSIVSIIPTISLYDLCKKYNVPKTIDYLSIDTEGSELAILEAHNFEEYSFKYITIEHNKNHEYQKDIFNFLTSKKYILDNSDRFKRIQNNNNLYFEDWYKLND